MELAQITNDLASRADKRAGIEAPWSKIKFDRQIVAIARVNRAACIYTDDDKLLTFAALNDISCIRVADLPIPASARQGQLPFEADEPNETPNDEPETA